MQIYVKYKKLTENAVMPTKGSSGAAGYDLYVDTQSDIEIQPGETIPFYTGIAVEIPYGYMGLLCSRSGISTKRGLRLPHGVAIIDQDFRGNIGVPLYNDSNEVQVVCKQERVAQICFIPVADAHMYPTEGELSWTERGAGGFGSTGR